MLHFTLSRAVCVVLVRFTLYTAEYDAGAFFVVQSRGVMLMPFALYEVVYDASAFRIVHSSV